MRVVELVCVSLALASVTAPATATTEPKPARAPDTRATWLVEAEAIAARIIDRDLFLTDATLARLDKAAMEARGEDRLVRLRSLATEAIVLSDAERGRVLFDAYRRFAEADESVEHAASAEMIAAFLPSLDGDYAQASRNIIAAMRKHREPQALAIGSRLLAYALADQGRPSEALKHVRIGISALDAAADEPALRAGLHDAWSYISLRFSDAESTVDHLRTAMEINVRSGAPIDGISILYIFANAASAAGEHAAAAQFASQEAALADRSGIPRETFFANLLCAKVSVAASDFAKAATCADAAVRFAAAPTEYLPRARIQLVEALARTGDGARARREYERLRSDVVGSGDLASIEQLPRLEANVLSAEGRYDAAFDRMRAYAESAEKAAANQFNAGARELRASIEGELGAAEGRAAASAAQADLMANIVDKQRMLLVLTICLVALATTGLFLTHRYAKRLRAARKAADAANRAKSEFLATMSHEIRTPLNGILGMAQALAAQSLPTEQRDQVATIIESGRTLTTLLNDVLDLAKIEAGKLEIAPVDADLRQTIRSVVKLFEAPAAVRGVALSLTLDDHVPSDLHFDVVRVRQCVANLLSNAVKFTSAGEVRVSVSAVPAEGGMRVTIAVADTGIGMDPATLEKVFAPFTQADASIGRRYGGTGLGLAISRRLARSMRGDLSAVSAMGVGTTMTFDFIAERARAAVGAPDAAARESREGTLGGVAVLIVDDVAVNRQVARFFVKAMGATPVEAESGRQALEILRAQQIDIVLMDVQMPEMDGFEATRLIRELPGATGAVPVIALTADVVERAREQCLAAGMSDFVAKPLDAGALAAALLRAMTKRAEAGTKPVRAGEAA